MAAGGSLESRGVLIKEKRTREKPLMQGDLESKSLELGREASEVVRPAG